MSDPRDSPARKSPTDAKRRKRTFFRPRSSPSPSRRIVAFRDVRREGNPVRDRGPAAFVLARLQCDVSERRRGSFGGTKGGTDDGDATMGEERVGVSEGASKGPSQVPYQHSINAIAGIAAVIARWLLEPAVERAGEALEPAPEPLVQVREDAGRDGRLQPRPL